MVKKLFLKSKSAVLSLGIAFSNASHKSQGDFTGALVILIVDARLLHKAGNSAKRAAARMKRHHTKGPP